MTPTTSVAPNETVQVPAVPVEQTLAPETSQQQTRTDIYKRYYENGGNPPAQEVSQPAQEPTAQVEPPVQATPAPVLPQDTTAATLAALQAQIAALQAALTPKLIEQPAQPALPIGDGVWLNEFVSLLREGKGMEAQTLLTSKLKDAVTPDISNQAASQAREIQRAESSIERFIDKFRSDPANAEVLPFENYITLDVERKLNELRSAGKLTSTDDLIRSYQTAVTESAESARKIAQTLRGAGKQEAAVRQREVLSTSTLAPNAVDASRQSATPQAEPQPETTEDYFAKRKAREAKLHSL
jgi:hypothetical protein